MAGELWLADSNILIRWVQPADPAYAIVRFILLWRRILIDHAVSGTQVHDARLVAAMTVHGVKRILTFNAETSRGIPALKPCIPHR
jgi:hypothetical protein